MDFQAQTIPCLPCTSLDATAEFYGLLGFELTYRQNSPNLYGVLERGRCALHVFGLKELKPEANFTCCLVLVDEVESLHATFGDGIRGKYKKIPTAGFPRLTRMKPGQKRFTVVDPDGNSLIFIRKDETSAKDEESESDAAKSTTKL